MTHARQTIRDAIVTAVTGLTTTGSNVFTNRLPSAAFEPSQLPCWIVSTIEGDGEDVEEQSMGLGSDKQRTLQVVLRGLAAGATGQASSNTLDTMAEEAETALANPVTGISNVSLKLRATEFELDEDHSADRPVSILLLYDAVYFAAEGAPGTIL